LFITTEPAAASTRKASPNEAALVLIRVPKTGTSVFLFSFHHFTKRGEALSRRFIAVFRAARQGGLPPGGGICSVRKPATLTSRAKRCTILTNRRNNKPRAEKGGAQTGEHGAFYG
jgi:hypothetical protein